ncbi:MAG: hypothetical protein CMD58_02295 [Gammaproteobacteria bacterium]|nr:hypothetical protein [Gammaproteobacteria bacterium]|tara:strand:- start:1577 stop:2608 length:1032 start_codon:yes stop_codon:yes gene_type:complete
MKRIFIYINIFFLSINISAVNEILIKSEIFPDKLSDFEFFLDSSAQIPHENVFPYELISTLFSDYSEKQRWVYVPENQKAKYQENWVFDFPTGSALIKTFYYPVDERDPEKGKRLLETRLLLKKESGWKAVSYAWNDQQNEAYKKIAGKTINASWIDFMGEQKQVRYRVPNVNQCKECHAANDEITPIGPKARNLNKKYNYHDGDFNQLVYWMKNQIIDQYPTDIVSPVDWSDQSLDINIRVRSYLDVNCGHCHSPTGNANSTGLYLHLDETRRTHLGIFKKPVATGRGSGGFKYSIVPGNPDESILLHRMVSMDPGVMMPESGRSLTHSEAVEMVREWINEL